MFERILVPLDGSEAAESALTVAALIPSRRLSLVVVESDSADPIALHAAVQDGQAYLERVAAPLRQQGRRVETHVAVGDPGKQIVAFAAPADLIVMASRGRGALGSMLLGNVADWVARHASVPTMIVRGGARPAASGPLKRIVVALDGSALAETALPVAEALAHDLGLPIHLVRAVDIDLVRATVEAGAAAAKAYAASREEARHQAEAYLAEQVQRLRDHRVIATSELRQGSPATALLAAVKAGDLVVLTTRERGGVEHWFPGSVAEEAVRHAVGPVLLVPAPSAK